MAVYVLDERLWFPPADEANEDGLLAIGGDLSEERLLLAYRNGIFPWFEDEIPLWWCPDPRFVLFPADLKISKSMQQIIRKDQFEFKINTAFENVIYHCKNISRADQQGTWITDDVEKSYINLYKKNYAFSAEAWQKNNLVGGLYGVRLGKIFFGESMFSIIPNASKFAFIKYVEQLKREGAQLIDCQVYTQHLQSMGAKMIDRKSFLQLLNKLIK
jgi:leucyl/phenylalanyl-tRNA---protein transferase